MLKNHVETGAIGALVAHAKALNNETVVLGKASIARAYEIVTFSHPKDFRRPFAEKVMAVYRELPAGTKNEMGEGTELVLHVHSGNIGERRSFASLDRLVTTTTP